MTLATRIRTADPLAGGLPDELLAPVAPDDGGTRPPAGRGRRARRGAVLGAALAAAVVVAALILAVAALRPAAPARGVSATFVALSASGDGAPPALVDVSVGIVRDRLDTLGVRGWAVAGAGGARIRVSCAGCDKRTDLAVARTVARRGRLLVYDWERDVLDPQCRARPADPDVTGGPVAGTAGSGDSTSYYGAVVRAARCPARRYAGMSRTAAAYYGVDPARRSVLAGPETSASAARAASRTPHVRIVRVAPGATVVGADDDTTPPPAPNDAAWYVLRDRPSLDGHDITRPRAETDPRGAPVVTFRFTAKGARRWSALTRAIARRGARSGRASANTGPGTFQHLAIVLDDRILTVPFVDYLGHPDGLDPRDGAQIEGGLTRASARALVALLKSGALPVQLGPDGP